MRIAIGFGLMTWGSPVTHQILDTDDAFEDDVGVGVGIPVVHNAGTVNQEDALHEGDVLPHLGLSRDRRNIAHLHSPTRHT